MPAQPATYRAQLRAPNSRNSRETAERFTFRSESNVRITDDARRMRNETNERLDARNERSSHARHTRYGRRSKHNVQVLVI